VVEGPGLVLRRRRRIGLGARDELDPGGGEGRQRVEVLGASGVHCLLTGERQRGREVVPARVRDGLAVGVDARQLERPRPGELGPGSVKQCSERGLARREPPHANVPLVHELDLLRKSPLLLLLRRLLLPLALALPVELGALLVDLPCREAREGSVGLDPRLEVGNVSFLAVEQRGAPG